MAAKVTKVISGIEQSVPMTQHNAQVIDVESVKCECCGLTEECTPAYIARVRERYEGRWICGLCAEAVKDESLRSQSKITTIWSVNYDSDDSFGPLWGPVSGTCFDALNLECVSHRDAFQ